MSEPGRVAVVERAKAAGWPALRNVNNAPLVESGETAWLLTAPRFSEADLREVSRVLNEIEERQASERYAESRRAELAAGPDEDMIRESQDEARADLERHERERPKRIEEKLNEIAGSLRGIAEALARR